MDILLLTAIRESKKRLVPAIRLQQQKNGRKELIIRYVRVFSPLQEIPIGVDLDTRWLLNGPISPNSKSGTAFQELTEAGVPISSIGYETPNQRQRSKKLVRLISYLPAAVGLLAQRWRAVRSLDLIAIQVLVGYHAYKRFFLRNKNLIPIIISDISPKLQMQWAGALSAGNKVLWWQDDYHHYNGFSAENYMPYTATYTVVLNQKGLETMEAKSPNASLFTRRQTTVHPMKSIPDQPRVGIATNAGYKADADSILLLERIRKALNADKLEFRLHPNSKLTKNQLKEDWIQIAPSNETIEEFAKRVDVVIVGNSAVQLKLLGLGVPVVHMEGLDQFGFDLYGYCKIGFVVGLDKQGVVSVRRINDYYKEGSRQQMLSAFMNVLDELQPLANLSKEAN